MNTHLSKAVKDEVKKLLPTLRKEVEQEFTHWNMYETNDRFFSDEKVLEILPYSAYEYILLSWSIEPGMATMESVVHAMNNKLFGDLRHITCHALRRLALKQND
ncbi:MAG TPA: hypothetical protein VK783_14845 [Bacteroidia bacterium]|jgi:hypothetical protein|nr:hypothetical protein [Bacteroidia bacterium]